MPWSKVPGSGWCKLDATQTITLLLNYLKQALAIPFNDELVDQMENSVVVMEQFLNSNQKPQQHNAFIASEQSLLWGHSFHPTPKSRSGVTMDDLLACSPEVGAEVPLYWFEIDNTLLDVLRLDDRSTPISMIEQLAPENSHSSKCDPLPLSSMGKCHYFAKPFSSKSDRKRKNHTAWVGREKCYQHPPYVLCTTRTQNGSQSFRSTFA